MKLSKITLAVAATLVAGSALAGPAATRIAISSGASASKGNLLLALQSRCAGTVTEFIGNGNVSTYVCAPGALTAGPAGTYATNVNTSDFTNFTGTAFAELRLNVSGGSFTSVCWFQGGAGSVGWPATGTTACPPVDLYVNPAATTLSVLEAVSPNQTTGPVAIGGLSDLEPTGFLGTVRGTLFIPPAAPMNFGQTFGVAVSNDLYNAMFTDQAPLLGTGCLVTDTKKPECVPTIGKAQMASLMSGNTGSSAYSRGANFLAPSVPFGTLLTYARRVDTSGTQAAAQQYFLGNVCNISSIGVVPENGSAFAITVQAQGGTGGVRTQLGLAGFSIGIMSGENNQTGQTWKWVRVGGMNMAESAAPAEVGVPFTNTATALSGQYDYWFQSRAVRPLGAAATFWSSINTGFGAVPVNTTRGLFRTNETAFTRGGTNSCTSVTTN
jgi:hypothetical protein